MIIRNVFLSIPQTYVSPVTEVRQVDFSVGVHIASGLYLHGVGGLDEYHGGVVGMGVQYPDPDRNVVDTP